MPLEDMGASSEAEEMNLVDDEEEGNIVFEEEVDRQERSGRASNDRTIEISESTRCRRD